MKILPINFNLHNPIAKNYPQKRQTYNVAIFEQPKDTVSISFKSKRHTVKDLRLIPNITCACCGDETIPSRDVDKFMNEKICYSAQEAINILEKAGYFKSKKPLVFDDNNKALIFCKTFANIYPKDTLENILTKKDVVEIEKDLDENTKNKIIQIKEMTKNIFHDSEYMVQELQAFEPLMHNMEREVFEILKRESAKYPKKTFTEILNNPKLINYHLKKLENKQDEVFQEMAAISEQMPDKQKEMIEEAIRQSKEIFDMPYSSENLPKRNTVIELFDALTYVMPVSEELKQIQITAYKLPSSINDKNSFIVKYSHNNPNQIADALIRGSIATHEHAKPRSNNGENDNSNYIVLCRNCNGERGRMPYPEFEKIHPEMPENTQKYIDIVIENINNGTLINFDSYPSDIRKALSEERKKENPISISKLNLLEAEKNRQRKPHIIPKQQKC